MYIPHFFNPFISWWIVELPSPLIFVNNYIMNICIQLSAWVSVFTLRGIHLGMELMDRMVNLHLTFWQAARWIPVVWSFYPWKLYQLHDLNQAVLLVFHLTLRKSSHFCCAKFGNTTDVHLFLLCVPTSPSMKRVMLNLLLSTRANSLSILDVQMGIKCHFLLTITSDLY